MGALEIVGYVALGFLVGGMSSFFGIGGGVTLVAVMVSVAGFTQQEAQATALAFMVPTAIVGVIATRRHGLGDLRASALLGFPGAVAAVGGALVALALPAETLRYVFAAFIFLLGMNMLLRPLPPDPEEEYQP